VLGTADGDDGLCPSPVILYQEGASTARLVAVWRGSHGVVVCSTEPVDRLAVALAVGVVHGGEQVGRPGQLELHDGQCEAGMTLEDAGEDQIA